MNPKPGEVYLADFGFAGKKRPVIIVSREDPDAPRALAVSVPLTTARRGSRYEVELGKLRFLRAESVANVQGVIAIEHHELRGPVGHLSATALAEVRDALRWMLEL